MKIVELAVAYIVWKWLIHVPLHHCCTRCCMKTTEIPVQLCIIVPLLSCHMKSADSSAAVVSSFCLTQYKNSWHVQLRCCSTVHSIWKWLTHVPLHHYCTRCCMKTTGPSVAIWNQLTQIQLHFYSHGHSMKTAGSAFASLCHLFCWRVCVKRFDTSTTASLFC